MKILITSNAGEPHKYLWSKILGTHHEVYVFAQIHLNTSRAVSSKGMSRLSNIYNTYKTDFRGKLKTKKSNAFFNQDEKIQATKYFKYDKQLIENFKESDCYFEFADIKGKEAIDKIKSINPDLILVQGGKILPTDFFESCSVGTIHMHGGFCPDYRGGRSWYACLFNDDLTHVGPTVQEIDAGIDTGNIIKKLNNELLSE